MLRGVSSIGSLNLATPGDWPYTGRPFRIGISLRRLHFRLSGRPLLRLCAAAFCFAARRNALRARICSGDGLAVGGFGRAIGASTVTGGNDCSCASAAVIAATAMRHPTVTF